jgi:pre-rRNA-processing protein TSR3
LSNTLAPTQPRIYVLLMRQDDPQKCTAAKLAKLRLATPLFRVAQIPSHAIVLNPFASANIIAADRTEVERKGLVAIDCSWEKVQNVFAIHFPGYSRRLPTLLASNPVNYAKRGKLSSVEALAAAVYITGYKERARQLLSSFKWGPGFLTLNSEPLESYASATTLQELAEAETQYF